MRSAPTTNQFSPASAKSLEPRAKSREDPPTEDSAHAFDPQRAARALDSRPVGGPLVRPGRYAGFGRTCPAWPPARAPASSIARSHQGTRATGRSRGSTPGPATAARSSTACCSARASSRWTCGARTSPQQSFLGIAFHVVDWTTYDAVYFRPFNFRAAAAGAALPLGPVRLAPGQHLAEAAGGAAGSVREGGRTRHPIRTAGSTPASSWRTSKVEVYVNGADDAEPRGGRPRRGEERRRGPVGRQRLRRRLRRT